MTLWQQTLWRSPLPPPLSSKVPFISLPIICTVSQLAFLLPVCLHTTARIVPFRLAMSFTCLKIQDGSIMDWKNRNGMKSRDMGGVGAVPNWRTQGESSYIQELWKNTDLVLPDLGYLKWEPPAEHCRGLVIWASGEATSGGLYWLCTASSGDEEAM
jgi:hypothetical protein